MTRGLPPWLRLAMIGGLTLWLCLSVFPFLWMTLISFRTPVDAFSVPPRLFAPLTLNNFYQLWVADEFWRYVINTTAVTRCTVLVSLTIGSLAGYAFSRYGGALGFWLLVVALIFRAMPQVVLLTAYKPTFLELGIWSRYETLKRDPSGLNRFGLPGEAWA